MRIKKGDRVIPSGVGRTNSWGKIVGTVLQRRGNSVFVHWDGTHFEDEMDIKEVKISDDKDKISDDKDKISDEKDKTLEQLIGNNEYLPDSRIAELLEDLEDKKT